MEKTGSFSQSERMSEEEAHEEANMLRGFLKKNGYEDEDIDAEILDETLQIVEDIKRLAEEEPATTKVLFKLGRIAGGASRGALKFLEGTLRFIAMADPVGEGGVAYDQNSLEVLADIAAAGGDVIKEKLTDASKELNNLKKAGRRYAKEQQD